MRSSRIMGLALAAALCSVGPVGGNVEVVHRPTSDPPFPRARNEPDPFPRRKRYKAPRDYSGYKPKGKHQEGRAGSKLARKAARGKL